MSFPIHFSSDKLMTYDAFLPYAHVMSTARKGYYRICELELAITNKLAVYAATFPSKNVSGGLKCADGISVPSTQPSTPGIP